MSEWLKQNSWALIIAAVTLVSTYTLYGYRLDQVEAQVKESKSAVVTLSENNQKNAITLTQIQKDIEYIKLQVSKITQ